MDLDFQTLSPGQRYKVLASVVVPRPIALVTTLGPGGVVNAAPYSFFNVFGADPGLVVLNVGDRGPGTPKDTAANAAAAGRFVVNLVSEAMGERMNWCAADFPPGVGEPAEVGFELAACPGTDVPRLAESPASLACGLLEARRYGNNRLLIGEVLAAHVADAAIDPATLRVDPSALKMLGRMGPPGGYCRTTDQFDLPRATHAAWLER